MTIESNAWVKTTDILTGLSFHNVKRFFLVQYCCHSFICNSIVVVQKVYNVNIQPTLHEQMRNSTDCLDRKYWNQSFSQYVQTQLNFLYYAVTGFMRKGEIGIVLLVPRESLLCINFWLFCDMSRVSYVINGSFVTFFIGS